MIQATVPATQKFSVVVAAVDASGSLPRCLRCIAASVAGLDAEIIVVSAGGVDAGRVSDLVPGGRIIEMPPETLTPVLWAEGIAASQGEVVALTTGHCFVAAEWARSLLGTVSAGAVAAGGPMRLARDASLVDAAIFFLRYSAFLDGPDGRASRDIAGDNAAYVRDRIPAGAWSRAAGFWEVDVNREIIREGGTIAWSPLAVAEFGQSFKLRSICRHRFAHGRIFGRSRVSQGMEGAAGIVAKSPAVPFVLLSRIARRVANRPAYRATFVAAIPTILALASCWASGEAAGALDTRTAHRG